MGVPRGVQWVCIGVGLTQLGLLVTIYATEAFTEDTFVSKELERLATFRLLLTLTVLTQVTTSGFYLFDWCDGPWDWRMWAGLFGAVSALCGWVVVVSTVMETADHVAGTMVYLAGTSVYFVMAIDMRVEGRYGEFFVIALFVMTLGLGIAFISTHLVGNLSASATVEWIGFMCQSLCFVSFFAVHSFREENTGEKAARSLKPRGNSVTIEIVPLLPGGDHGPPGRAPRYREEDGGVASGMV
jgi:hypothetical protein